MEAEKKEQSQIDTHWSVVASQESLPYGVFYTYEPKQVLLKIYISMCQSDWSVWCHENRTNQAPDFSMLMWQFPSVLKPP